MNRQVSWRFWGAPVTVDPDEWTLRPQRGVGPRHRPVRARALGADLPDVAATRDLILRAHPWRRYRPRTDFHWATEPRVYRQVME